MESCISPHVIFHYMNITIYLAILSLMYIQVSNLQSTTMITQYLGQEDRMEKEMVPYSSILAWKIPWAEGPGRL